MQTEMYIQLHYLFIKIIPISKPINEFNLYSVFTFITRHYLWKRIIIKLYIYIYIYIICMCVCMCMCVCIYVCMYGCVYVCIYTVTFSN